MLTSFRNFFNRSSALFVNGVVFNSRKGQTVGGDLPPLTFQESYNFISGKMPAIKLAEKFLTKYDSTYGDKHQGIRTVARALPPEAVYSFLAELTKNDTFKKLSHDLQASCLVSGFKEGNYIGETRFLRDIAEPYINQLDLTDEQKSYHFYAIGRYFHPRKIDAFLTTEVNNSKRFLNLSANNQAYFLKHFFLQIKEERISSATINFLESNMLSSVSNKVQKRLTNTVNTICSWKAPKPQPRPS